MKKRSVVVQGFPGCFHNEAAQKFWSDAELEILPSSNFDELAEVLLEDNGPDHGIMAIENSIAGSILQNYRILRENNFWIIGEVYLRIKLNLMALPGQKIEDLSEVASHPMAIRQSLKYFKDYPSIRLVESEDTALSAKKIREKELKGAGAIASAAAAKLYDLDIIESGIETSKVNYTRFFIIDKDRSELLADKVDKASIYCRVSDTEGSLLKVLERISAYKMNISKLQSYPVLGKLNEYFFHIDLNFKSKEDFFKLHKELKKVTIQLRTLGIYKKSNYDH